MAMSDLELLQLVDTVKERQRGPKGEPGVGIDSVEQYDGQSFTLRLTDGSFKRIDLQKVPMEQPGAPGQRGPKGDVGPAGRDGRGGKDGLQGAPGLPGADGTTVETAIVSSAGNLLLGLSDGTIIDAGRVVGPAGATGSAGPAGLPGERGSDGAAVLSGPRAPQESDGAEGDHWIDISSAEFSFYKKGGNGWSKLANLRQPAPNPRIGVAGGGHGGASDGGSGTGGSVVHVGPDRPSFPSQGDLWFDTNDADGRMYVWTGSDWEPVLPQPDLDGYATNGYVDAQDNALGQRIDNVESDVATKATKAELATATAALPYRLETDKVVRSADLPAKRAADGDAAPAYAGGEIQLVDNLGMFHNVRFSGVNGVTTSSDQQGIIVDGTGLMPRNLLNLPELP